MIYFSFSRRLSLSPKQTHLRRLSIVFSEHLSGGRSHISGELSAFNSARISRISSAFSSGVMSTSPSSSIKMNLTLWWASPTHTSDHHHLLGAGLSRTHFVARLSGPGPFSFLTKWSSCPQTGMLHPLLLLPCAGTQQRVRVDLVSDFRRFWLLSFLPSYLKSRKIFLLVFRNFTAIVVLLQKGTSSSSFFIFLLTTLLKSSSVLVFSS